MDNIRATYLALVKGKKEKEKTSTYVRRNAIYEQIQSQNLNRRKITVRNIHKKKKKKLPVFKLYILHGYESKREPISIH